MAEWIIGILAAVGAVLAALLKGSVGREKKLKEEKRDAEDRLHILQSQMEAVNECRKDLGLIEGKAEKEKPERKDSPASGDSASRLDRLNGLHKRSGRNG